jgi:sigma-B regulation protein RsbU (phosphoserine phosphatase)
LLLVLVVIVATAGPIVYFTLSEFTGEMITEEARSARNVLDLVQLNIENEYKGIKFYEEKALERRKEALRAHTQILFASFDKWAELAEKGELSLEEAQKAALSSVVTLRYGNGDYFYVYDMNLVAIGHPDPNIQGRDMSEHKDRSGVYSLRVTRDIIRESPGREGFKFFYWTRLKNGQELPSKGAAVQGEQGAPVEPENPRASDQTEEVRKVAFVKLYPKWNWIVGTGVYVDDIDKNVESKRQEVIRNLNRTMEKIRIAKTGCVFIVNSKKEFVVYPPSMASELPKFAEGRPGAKLIDDIISYPAAGTRPLRYLWDKKGHEGEFRFAKEAYVSHFEPLDWHVAATVLVDEIQEPARRLAGGQMVIAGIVLVAGMGLAATAAELVRCDFALSPVMDSSLGRISDGRRDEVAGLAGALRGMIHALDRYIVDLRETTAVKERMESELNVAYNIQMSFLPKLFPAFPEREEFDLYATMEPAKEVGGDLYDFFFIDEEHLFFCIGDVSGKGVPAALFMSVTKTLIGAQKSLSDPSRILHKVNGDLCEGNESLMFVTMFCGVLNTLTGELLYSNAGHNPPLLLRRDGRAEWLTLPRGMALGVMEEAGFETSSIRLDPEDMVIAYTDGVTEAFNAALELYSEERLIRHVSRCARKSPKEAIETIMASVESFAAHTSQSDDITMLGLKYRGTKDVVSD